MILLRTRATDLPELMDDPECDPRLLAATYRQFGPLNRVLSGWRGLWVHRIRHFVVPRRRYRILDVGSGGGDLARNLAGWGARDGLDVRVTAADPDERAFAFASRHPLPGVDYLQADSSQLADDGARFDLVVSNHVLHHLDAEAFGRLLADCEVLAPRALHSDLRRSAVAYTGFALATLPFARTSFVHTDGLRSIRRSFTPPELRFGVPPGWQVERDEPFRLLLTRGMRRAGIG